jgi:hypothetical protein
MDSIDNFLSRFKNLTAPDIFIREKTSEILSENLDIKLSIKEISFNKKSGIIFLKSNPTQKTKIFLNKTILIEKINIILKKDLVRDIR